jgi:NhaC family Na+:H+ antiporter
MRDTLKIKVILFILLFSVVMVIVFDKPLYFALMFTCAFTWLLIHRKSKVPILIRHNVKSVSKTMLLMFLISITVPLLMASGTLPTLIYYVSEMMIGNNLLLSAFALSTGLSMVIGSAIGTLTILLPLFASIAVQAGVSPAFIVGALLSGVYIGDRCSPLSSALHLLSTITETDYLKNMRLLILSAILPFSVAFLMYWQLGDGFRVPLLGGNAVIADFFSVSIWTLVPLVLMVLLLVIKQPITRVMTLVFCICLLMTIRLGISFSTLWETLFNGYASPHEPLQSFLKTSGFRQMINVILVIFFSGILNSLLEADDLIQYLIAPFVRNLPSKSRLLLNTGLLSILLSMVTCSQAMTAMISGKYLAPYYDTFKLRRELLVMMIANTGLNVVSIIPWNVNGIMIKQLSGVSPLEYAPLSFFLISLTVITLTLYPWLFSKSLRKL